MRWLRCLLPVALLLLPARALACACCDGTQVVKAVGWAPQADAILFDDESLVGCEPERTRLVMRSAPRQLACRKWTTGTMLLECTPPVERDAPSVLPADYSLPIRAARARDLRAVLRMPKRAGEFPARIVAVDVFAGGTWKPLTQIELVPKVPFADVDGSRFEGVFDTAPELPIELAVLPAPDGKRGIVAFWYIDGSPGTGFFSTRLEWVELPSSIGVGAGKASVFDTLPAHDPAKFAALKFPDPIVSGPARLAVPAFGEKRELGTAAAAERHNAFGMERYRAGDLGTAVRHFVHALSHDSESPLPRYNLACAYARLGMPEHAMWQLSVLARARCSKCAERLVRARSDEDFATLRERADFRALVCGDAGDCFPPAPAPSASSVPATTPPVTQAAEAPKAPSSRSCRCALESYPGTDRSALAVCVLAIAAACYRRR